MSLFLVVALPALAPSPDTGTPESPASPGGPGVDALWGTVRQELAVLRDAPLRAFVPGRLEVLTEGLEEADDDPSVAYTSCADEALHAVGRAIDAGASRIAVLPVALAIDEREGSPGAPDDDDLDRLQRGLDGIGRRHPGVELTYVGPPFDDPPALEAAIAALRPPGSEEPALLAASVERAFRGDVDRFARFMRVLQEGVPPGTTIVLRGSAVQGESYRTGEPFDARGPGTSDLDIVLVGDAAMAEWHPGAFYLPGVNTMPLWDEAREVAPGLEPARAAAQEIAGRPVAIQAMARWFLDLRSGLQGTPYATLG